MTELRKTWADKLVQDVKKVMERGIDALVRPELGSQLSFESAKDTFESILALYAGLSRLPVGRLPEGTLQELLTMTGATNELMNRVSGFSLTTPGSDPLTARNSILASIEQNYSQVCRMVLPVVAFWSSEGEHRRELTDQLETAVASSRALRDELVNIVEVARSAAGQVGVAKYSEYFASEAEQHRRAGNWWLLVTVVVALAAIGFGVFLLQSYIKQAQELTVAKSIQLAVAKAAVLSVLYMAVVWCGRVYKAQRHNQVVNRHRLNALNTFEAFVKAASDDQTKNAVLLQAARATFSPQKTGYLGRDAEAQESPQIMEIIRRVTSGEQARQ